MSTPRRLKVFLCHASQDKPMIRELNRRLSTESWIDIWLDEEKLLPGQDWDLEIQTAIREADIIIVCLSQESVSREGYVQKEFRRALSYAEEKPEGTTYIIPLRLDDCTPPTRFRQWQWVDYSARNSWEKLLKSLQLRAKKLGITHAFEANNSTDLSAKVHLEPSGFTPGGRPFYVFGGMAVVKVAAGDFYMGADDIEVARPQHLVYQLSYDFYIGQYPVTNQEYSLFLRDTSQPIILPRNKGNHPVVNVSWNQSHEFIAWLNDKWQATLPVGYKFRLPSEAEWEKAARGVEGNEYSWGNRFYPNRCNSMEGGIQDTTDVGTFSPRGDSAFGAADMAGNVWEWTRTLVSTYFRYPYQADDGREDEGTDETVGHVLRGGSFLHDKGSARCASRYLPESASGSATFGFRVAICPSIE